MSKKKNRFFVIFAIIYYIVLIGLMIYGTFNDVKIDMALFNPENKLAILAESFGPFVYWGMWGPAITVIFLCRRDLNESLAVINKLVPVIKPVKNTSSGAYKFFDFVVKFITTVGFFVLAMVGWKKLIENVLKNILLMMDKEDMSQAFYFIVCTIFTAIVILLCRNIDKNKLRKLEGLALAGVLFGIFLKLIEEIKPITNRVRFREMVAYSNHFLNEEGLSEGKHSPLTSDMKNSTDFSAFTPWYKIGDDMGIYNRTDSFPSGHTSCACTSFLLYLFTCAYDKLKKYAPFALCVSAVYVVGIGFTRLIAGAHYLTDVAGAAILGFTFFVLVTAIYNSFVNRGVIGCKD